MSGIARPAYGSTHTSDWNRGHVSDDFIKTRSNDS